MPGTHAPEKHWRKWTAEEDEYLEQNWGSLSMGTMARVLGRTESAIQLRAGRLELGPWLMAGDYVTLAQLAKALGRGESLTTIKHIWIEKKGMPVHRKLVRRLRVTVVCLPEFWKWAEENRSFVDFGKMEPLALGKEPAWVAEQRKKVAVGYFLPRKWTPYEDELLRSLLAAQKYTSQEMSVLLKRSGGAILRHCLELGLPGRPIRASSHNSWSDAQKEAVKSGILNGDSYSLISARIGKSEKAVRGYVWRVYGTEELDKARTRMVRGRAG